MKPATRRVAREAYESRDKDLRMVMSAPDERLSVLKTSSKPMLVVLTQFVSLTSGTSFGSAKVMSTHYSRISTLLTEPVNCLTLYRAAPCWAVSITWMVALFPITAVKLTGNGTCGKQKLPGYN